MSKEAVVVDDEMYRAYDNFVDMFYPGEYARGHFFWAFIGMKKAPRTTDGMWRLPEPNVRIIRMLAGPHHKTIAKAMIANGHQYKVPVNE